MKAWGHDELAEDLAATLIGPRRMVWTNIQLGPAGSPRPDVYTLDKSFAHPNAVAYECKISHADFRADVTAAKWVSYLDYAYCVIFAAPAGLLQKAEIPEQCGLIQRHETSWRLAKRATPVPKLIAQEALLKLIIDGVAREGPRQRARRWHEGDWTREFARRFGATAARYVGDAASIHEDLKRAEERRAEILATAERDAQAIRERATVEAPTKWRELLDVLGLDAEASRFTVDEAIRKLRRSTNGGEHAAVLRQTVDSLRRIVANAEHLCGTVLEG